MADDFEGFDENEFEDSPIKTGVLQGYYCSKSDCDEWVSGYQTNNDRKRFHNKYKHMRPKEKRGRKSCGLCQKWFLKKINLRQHIQQVHCQTVSRGQCFLCRKTFKPTSMSNHLKNVHENYEDEDDEDSPIKHEDEDDEGDIIENKDEDDEGDIIKDVEVATTKHEDEDDEDSPIKYEDVEYLDEENYDLENQEFDAATQLRVDKFFDEIFQNPASHLLQDKNTKTDEKQGMNTKPIIQEMRSYTSVNARSKPRISPTICDEWGDDDSPSNPLQESRQLTSSRVTSTVCVSSSSDNIRKKRKNVHDNKRDGSLAKRPRF